MKVEYRKLNGGNTLFRMTEYGDYWINKKFNKSWKEVEPDYGPHPSFDFDLLSEEEALDYALSIGMSKEAFYGNEEI